MDGGELTELVREHADSWDARMCGWETRTKERGSFGSVGKSCTV
jgi:hypothetical protein